MISGPLITCIGILSAAATKSSPRLRIQHEKSRPVFRTVERPLRNNVFIIARTTPSNRLDRTARRTPSGADFSTAALLIDGPPRILPAYERPTLGSFPKAAQQACLN